MRSKRRMFGLGIGVVLVAGTALACSAREEVGTAGQAISEVNCAYRTISSPNGATLSSYANSCNGTTQTSANATYGYTNCTDGYIWEVTSITSGSISRTVVASVVPSALPTTQADCQNATVTMYLYGLDTTNDIQYAFTSSVNAVAGTWNPGGGGLPGTCTFPTLTANLDSWPNGADGGNVTVDGLRAIGQAKNGSSKVEVKMGLALTTSDFNGNCVP